MVHKSRTLQMKAALHTFALFSGRSTIRLVYQHGSDFRYHDFVCDTRVAKQIVLKVTNILEMRSSHVLQEYIAHRERKIQKRHTISLMPS